MSPHARREDVDGVITVTFTRPEKRNAVDHEMFESILDAVRDLRDHDDLRVLVLTAEGDYYTAGLDVATVRPDAFGVATDGVVRGSNVRVQMSDADRPVRRHGAGGETHHPGRPGPLLRRRGGDGRIVRLPVRSRRRHLLPA